MTEEQVLHIPSLSQAHFLLQKGQPSERLFILCHGFMSTHKKMWSRFQARLPSGSSILSVSGPFPIPVKEPEAWKIGYSWFFYDNIKQYYFLDYRVCQTYIRNLVNELGFESHPKTIIGYSQGGYASVHMAESLKHVDHIIGLGCQFKIKDPQWEDNLIVESLHGDQDAVVELSGARENFAKLPEKNRGRFEVFEGVEHKPSDEMLELAAQWASEKRES